MLLKNERKLKIMFIFFCLKEKSSGLFARIAEDIVRFLSSLEPAQETVAEISTKVIRVIIKPQLAELTAATKKKFLLFF